ncbi:hypothetical protein IWQ60_007011 [Tieghemiomyces parasiticus]|uniref:Phosphoacetylglucosamine mutase n=1 Tax=Tieghemiomyces parasiticus TaxID=78921 RepID=A0A9W8A152_9FUNG|nr:hypothetical protein IWQ60_007011 [Tieghemiomyces parasiticus]
MSFDLSALVTASAQYPKPPNVTFTYGTAGFRLQGDLLPSVAFRVGVLAVLRSKKMDGRTIGVMLTASHNPARDNGLKVVDPRGEMLDTTWEPFATRLANANDATEIASVMEELRSAKTIDMSKPAHVVIGRDTRPTGPALVKALTDCLTALGSTVTYQDYGVLTTPQLHYIVRCINTHGAYGEPTEDGYYTKLATAFRTLVSGHRRLSPLTVDCANGVGAPKLRALAERIGEANLAVELVNDNIEAADQLNYQCGADFVKTQQNFSANVEGRPLERCCALDGDADRLVYFYRDETDHAFKLLDGDKISGLAAMFITDLTRAAGLTDLNVGVVQTAYANGSSTAYLKEVLQLPVACVCTGVKHLHHEAEKFDIGVYFEANGHGTVLFNHAATQALSKAQARSPAQAEALDQLRALVDLVNQTVGDAFSDLLLVEVILTHRQWSLSQWDHAYTDLPNRLVKVVVADRTAFRTTNADTQLVEPAGLQDKVNELVAKYRGGRAFVRPSGTEDVVRVYAEAANRHECDQLAFKLGGLVFDLAGGKGERPAEFL